MRNVNILKHSLKQQPGVMLVHPPMLGGQTDMQRCKQPQADKLATHFMSLCDKKSIQTVICVE